MKRIPALACALFLLLPAAAQAAQDPNAGFTAHGTLVAQVAVAGTRINLGGDIAMMSRGNMLRFDLLRLSVPGTEPTLNALITQFLPQGGITAVVDESQGSTTVWSDARRKFYVFPGKPASAPPAAASLGGGIPGAAGSIVQMLETGRALRDFTTFNESIAIRGRGTVNGHPSTNVHVAYRAQKRGGALSDITADLSLAEDVQYLPVRISGSLKPGNYTGRLDFTSINTMAPDASAFSIPSGYAQAADPSEVFGAGIPH